MHRVYLLFFALVMSFTIVNAQPLVKVSGKVVDLENNPLEQVTVAILGQQESTLTAADGSYTIYAKTIKFTIYQRNFKLKIKKHVYSCNKRGPNIICVLCG